jgi:hypothetical protein
MEEWKKKFESRISDLQDHSDMHSEKFEKLLQIIGNSPNFALTQENTIRFKVNEEAFHVSCNSTLTDTGVFHTIRIEQIPKQIFADGRHKNIIVDEFHITNGQQLIYFELVRYVTKYISAKHGLISSELKDILYSDAIYSKGAKNV